MFRALFLAFVAAFAVAIEAGSPTCSEDAPGHCIEDIPANVNLLQVQHSLKKNEEPLLRCIITGMERSGTTMFSTYMQSIPGVFGAFETGFLLSKSPAQFLKVWPFYQWSLQSENWNSEPYWSFNLTSANMAELLKVDTHAKMYSYVKEHSPLFAGKVPTRWLVDKTPAYVYHLPSVMARSPDVPVFVLQRDDEEVEASWRSHWSSTFNYEVYKNHRKQAQASIQAAVQLYPERIHVIDYNLFKTKEGAQRAMREACDHVGFEWKDEYFTLENFLAKIHGLNHMGPTDADEVLEGQRKYWK